MDIPASEFAEYAESVVELAADGPYSAPLRASGELLRDSYDINFAESRQASGPAWRPRKDPIPQHPLLILSGVLRSAATTEGATGNISEVGTHEAAFGVSRDEIPYARRQQYGDNPEGIRARPYIGVTNETLDQCGELIATYAIDLF